MSKSSGESWVSAPDGTRYWGEYGAAGLLVYREGRGVLLQHRAEWSHHGGTWGLPGGARHEGESAEDAAMREAAEEADVPGSVLRVLFCSTLDLGFWSYTTVVVRSESDFEARITDPESIELRWVAIEKIETMPLHPGFAASWPQLRKRLVASEEIGADRI